jgi:ketosteroid isomerase-like protein
MSQENVELVRRLFEAAARRDTAALFDLYDPYTRRLVPLSKGCPRSRGLSEQEREIP